MKTTKENVQVIESIAVQTESKKVQSFNTLKDRKSLQRSKISDKKRSENQEMNAITKSENKAIRDDYKSLLNLFNYFKRAQSFKNIHGQNVQPFSILGTMDLNGVISGLARGARYTEKEIQNSMIDFDKLESVEQFDASEKGRKINDLIVNCIFKGAKTQETVVSLVELVGLQRTTKNNIVISDKVLLFIEAFYPQYVNANIELSLLRDEAHAKIEAKEQQKEMIKEFLASVK